MNLDKLDENRVEMALTKLAVEGQMTTQNIIYHNFY